MTKRTKGQIFAVGLGPDGNDHLSAAAREVLKYVDIVIGYRRYCQQIENVIADKEVIVSGMGDELGRCEKAIDRAAQGSKIAVVCSGDAGIYGMAGLLFEVAEEHGNPDIGIEVVPGITAGSAAAAVLGAPLMNDFTVVSLSDLLTPRGTVQKRLNAAVQGDFVTVLYNPQSRTRQDLLPEAIETFVNARGAYQAAGFVKNAGRDEQESWIGTLQDLPVRCIDMATVIVIGNSETEIIEGRLVTRRGYTLRDGTL